MKIENKLIFTTLLTLQFLPCFSQNWVINTLRTDIVGAWGRIGDFDRDNDPDILVQSGDSVLWYENHRSEWKPHVIDATFYNSVYSYLDVIDMDNDGDLDVFKAPEKGNGTDVLTWDENQNKGMVWKKHTIVTIAQTLGWMQGAAGDVDKDGDIDFVVPEYNTGSLVKGSLYWLENLGNDQWKKNSLRTNMSHFYATLADMDADGDLDIVNSNGAVSWLENQLPNTSWTVHSVANITTGVHILGFCGDLNNDKKPDIVSGTAQPTTGLGYYANANWSKTTILENFNGFFSPLSDIDGDGDFDMAYGGNGVTQAFPLGWVENNNNGTSWVRHDITLPHMLHIVPAGIVDIDGDGDRDIVALDFNVATGRGSVFWAANPQIRTRVFDVSKSLENKFRISPNPTKDVIQIDKIDETDNVRLVTLTNSQEQTVYSEKGQIQQVNTAYLPVGMYLLYVKTDKGDFSTKIMKE